MVLVGFVVVVDGGWLGVLPKGSLRVVSVEENETVASADEEVIAVNSQVNGAGDIAVPR